MPLEARMELITKHQPAVGLGGMWYNKYGMLWNVPPSYGDMSRVMMQVIDAERLFHTGAVRFPGALGRTYRPKTIQPNPAPPVIDPTDIVTYTTFSIGLRGEPQGGSDTMSKDHIMQVDRVSDFGRSGWLEYRGALFESDVKQTLGGMSEEGGGFFLDGFIDAFSNTLNNLATEAGFQWVRFSQPSTLVNIEVQGKKVIKHYTFGQTLIIPINGFQLRGIRIDRSANKYFDQA